MGVNDTEIKAIYYRVGRRGTVILTITTPGGQTFTDKVDMVKEAARAKLPSSTTRVNTCMAVRRSIVRIKRIKPENA